MACKDTRVELVQELEKFKAEYLRANPNPRPSNLAFIDQTIAEAKAGEYHDYKNQKYACGKVEVYTRLLAMECPELAERVKDGEFDEEADAEDIAMMKSQLPPAMWAAMGLT